MDILDGPGGDNGAAHRHRFVEERTIMQRDRTLLKRGCLQAQLHPGTLIRHAPHRRMQRIAPGGHTTGQPWPLTRWRRQSGRGQAHLVAPDGKGHLMAYRYIRRRHYEPLTVWGMEHGIRRSC